MHGAKMGECKSEVTEGDCGDTSADQLQTPGMCSWNTLARDFAICSSNFFPFNCFFLGCVCVGGQSIQKLIEIKIIFQSQIC